MKNQYFGDINDYRKYGLLRILSNMGQIKTAVCWMRTPDDSRDDGKRKAYLQDPDKWSRYDQALFESLASCPDTEQDKLKWAESNNILPSTVFHSTMLTDDRSQRQQYMDEFLKKAKGCPLVFFDPDNGVEVRSKPRGRKDACKYLYSDELYKTFHAGHSVLVYQHFPRVERNQFICCLAADLRVLAAIPQVLSFRTSHVVFMLIPQACGLAYFRCRGEEVERRWRSQIGYERYPRT